MLQAMQGLQFQGHLKRGVFILLLK